MSDKNPKFYITTSIAYTNAPPHIGFALESIQADVLARYHRTLKEDVWFLTGTDEHGTKIVKVAESEKKDTLSFVNELSQKFQDLKKYLNLSNDDFVRTTDKKRHWPVVSEVWQKLNKKGDIYKEDYKGYYCSGCEAYITQKSKGLVPAECLVHPNLKPILIKEKNYFFKLSKYGDKIKNLFEKNKIEIIPETKKNEILEILNQEWTESSDDSSKKKGLRDISFSRAKKNLKWGIAVPGDNSQTIYVWADALVNYLSALDYPNGEKFKKYWPANVHCIGKDILKFHALIWPAMLLSLELPLPKKIFVHGFINVDGQKMSKSLGNVVDPFLLVDKYGTDAVRYYLLREISSSEDGDFSYGKFEQRYNGDLAGGIGNLLSRTIALSTKLNVSQTKSSSKINKAVNTANKEYQKYLNGFKFNEALKSIWELIGFCDKYIDKEKPWEAKKNDSQVVSDLFFALQNIADLLYPFLPETSEKIKQLLKEKKREALFPRI